MEHNQNTIATIYHQRAIRIKFLDDSLLFFFISQLKKLAVIETLFWQLGTRFSGRCRWRDIQSTPDNSNLQGKSKIVRVIGSSKKIAGSKEKTVFTAQ